MSDPFIKFETDLLKELSPRQCVLLAVIKSMALKKGYAYAQNSTFAQIMNCSVDIIQRDLNELEAKEFVQRRLIKNEKNNSTKRMIYPHHKNTVPPTENLQHPHHENPMTPTTNLQHTPPQNCGVDTNKEIIINNNENDTIGIALNLWFEHNKQMGKILTAVAIKMLREDAEIKYASPAHFLNSVKFSIKNNYKTIVDNNDRPSGPINYATPD
mgnify:FL=1